MIVLRTFNVKIKDGGSKVAGILNGTSFSHVKTLWLIRNYHLSILLILTESILLEMHGWDSVGFPTS